MSLIYFIFSQNAVASRTDVFIEYMTGALTNAISIFLSEITNNEVAVFRSKKQLASPYELHWFLSSSTSSSCCCDFTRVPFIFKNIKIMRSHILSCPISYLCLGNYNNMLLKTRKLTGKFIVSNIYSKSTKKFVPTILKYNYFCRLLYQSNSKIMPSADPSKRLSPGDPNSFSRPGRNI